MLKNKMYVDVLAVYETNARVTKMVENGTLEFFVEGLFQKHFLPYLRKLALIVSGFT